MRAFQRLPEPELQRLDIDLATPINVATETGAERAKRLTQAWKQVGLFPLILALDVCLKPR